MPLFHAHIEGGVNVPEMGNTEMARREIGLKILHAPLTPITEKTTYQYRRRRFIVEPQSANDTWTVTEEQKRLWILQKVRRKLHLKNPDFKSVTRYTLPEKHDRVFMGDILVTGFSMLYPQVEVFRFVEDVLIYRRNHTKSQPQLPRLSESQPIR